jgi:MFS family permease
MERVYTFPIFAVAAFAGPLLGPIIGGFIVQSPYLSWRWVDWMTLIISALVLGIVVFFQPETFPPVLLKWKAQHLRELTGDDRYRAEMEIRSETFMQRLGTALYRPFLLTATEPIIILIAIYLTVVYIGEFLRSHRLTTRVLTVGNSTVHFSGRLQLHFRRNPRHFRGHHRLVFRRYHHWTLHIDGSRTLDLSLGERGDGES